MSLKPIDEQSVAELIGSLIEAYFKTTNVAYNSNNGHVRAVREQLARALQDVQSVPVQHLGRRHPR